MFRLLSASHHQALHNQNLKKCYSTSSDSGLGYCVRPGDGSLIRAETCCLHRCKFVLINSSVGRLFGLHFYSLLLYTAGWEASKNDNVGSTGHRKLMV
jgi:hypothetical protein